MQLNQVTVYVTHIQNSIKFYKQMGFKLIVHSPHYARFIVPGNGATFSVHLADSVPPSATMIYFECDDVDATYNQLKAEGIKFLMPPTDQSWLWRETYLADPDGNKLCLYHAGENRLNPPWRVDG
jgi:catechol 2,3-dioxygenase-like lactoylglutathione lyase family enzyme